VEQGLKVSLRGHGGECLTSSGLDHRDRRDYTPGNQAIFDGSPDGGASDGLAGCYMAPLTTITGGSATWLGTGIFSARDSHVMFEMTGGRVYRCTIEGMAIQNAELSLDLCSCNLGC